MPKPTLSTPKTKLTTKLATRQEAILIENLYSYLLSIPPHLLTSLKLTHLLDKQWNPVYEWACAFEKPSNPLSGLDYSTTFHPPFPFQKLVNFRKLLTIPVFLNKSKIHEQYLFDDTQEVHPYSEQAFLAATFPLLDLRNININLRTHPSLTLHGYASSADPQSAWTQESTHLSVPLHGGSSTVEMELKNWTQKSAPLSLLLFLQYRQGLNLHETTLLSRLHALHAWMKLFPLLHETLTALHFTSVRHTADQSFKPHPAINPLLGSQQSATYAAPHTPQIPHFHKDNWTTLNITFDHYVADGIVVNLQTPHSSKSSSYDITPAGLQELRTYVTQIEQKLHLEQITC